MFHPQLLPAIIGAIIGLPLVVLACVWLVRRWTRLGRKRWIFAAAIALFECAYWLNVYAWLIEPKLLVVREVEIASEHWSGAPLRIAVLSDTHVGGPHVDAARMGRIVERVNALQPDIVVLLGDYVGGHAPEALSAAAARTMTRCLSGIAAFAAFRSAAGRRRCHRQSRCLVRARGHVARALRRCRRSCWP